jgi:hypothetical protein
MTLANVLDESKADAERMHVTQIDELVETIRTEALAHAQSKLGPIARGLDPARPCAHGDFLCHFMYGLATGVARALAQHDERVLGVYLFDPSANPADEVGQDLPPETQVHLLVLVTAPSAALSAFTASLDRALTARLRAQDPIFAGRESTLDVTLISESDVRLGLGQAALLSAVFTPPIKLWQRAKY